MRALNFARTCFGALAIVALTGCGYSAEDTCQGWCEQENRCEDKEQIDCEEESAAMTTCVDFVEDVSEDCQDAWGGYYSCLNDVDSCNNEEQDRECGSEFGEVIESCAGEGNPFSPL